MSDRKATSIRLSAEADRLLDQLKDQTGAPRSVVIEMAIREYADRRSSMSAQTNELAIGSRVTVWGKLGTISGTWRRGFGVTFDDGTGGQYAYETVKPSDVPAPSDPRGHMCRNCGAISGAQPGQKCPECLDIV